MTVSEWMQIQSLLLAACLAPLLVFLVGGELAVVLVGPFCVALAWGLLGRRLRTVRGDRVVLDQDVQPPLR